jgi:hypothetical protein
MNLASLYEEFKKTGECPTSDFLNLKRDGNFFDKLKGEKLCLVSNHFSGDYLCVCLEVERPVRTQMVRFFLAEDGKLIASGIPLEEFLFHCSEEERENVTGFSVINLEVLKAAVSEWLYKELKELQEKFRSEMASEVRRLNRYYQESFDELNHKREVLYYHNYFFEKEKQLEKEFEQLNEELHNHEILLSRKYRVKWNCNCLFWGTVLK